MAMVSYYSSSKVTEIQAQEPKFQSRNPHRVRGGGIHRQSQHSYDGMAGRDRDVWKLQGELACSKRQGELACSTKRQTREILPKVKKMRMGPQGVL